METWDPLRGVAASRLHRLGRQQPRAHGALSGRGYVPGVIGWSAWRQNGHPELAKRTFVLAEVRWNALSSAAAR